MKQNIALLIGLVLFFSSCKTNTYLPKPAKFGNYPKGMRLEVNLNKGQKIAGELIAVENTDLYLMVMEKDILTFNFMDISKAQIQLAMTANDSGRLTAGPFIPLLTISHGWFMFLTLPLNLAIVIPTVASQRSGFYSIDYPRAITWEELGKFARFPQGIPEGMNLEEFKSALTKK